MLADLIRNGFGENPHLNCAQKILYGANKVYDLGLSEDALYLANGFGGGMGIESTCGALTAGIMVLGKLFPITDDESKKYLYALNKEFLEEYRKLMGDIECKPLKEEHRREDVGCSPVIINAAELLDSIIERELKVNK